MKTIGIGVLLASLAGTTALAECPQRGDLDRGIQITFDDGSISNFFSSAKNTVTEINFFEGDDYYYGIQMYRGLLEVGYYGADSQGILPGEYGTFEYDFEIDDVTPPISGDVVSGEQTLTGPLGEIIDVVDFAVTVGNPGTVTIGDCRYTYIPVETLYIYPDFDTLVELNYISELGLSYMSRFRDDIGDDYYTAVSISYMN